MILGCSFSDNSVVKFDNILLDFRSFAIDSLMLVNVKYRNNWLFVQPEIYYSRKIKKKTETNQAEWKRVSEICDKLTFLGMHAWPSCWLTLLSSPQPELSSFSPADIY